MSLKTTLEALGNQVRRLSGKTNKMTLDAMTQALSGVNIGANVSGADASITDVLNGKKFVGANGVLETGAMTNNGAVSKTLDTSTKTYTIPAGYHNGGGKVQIETQTKSVTPSSSAQTVYPDAGKVLSAVTVSASGGRTVYSGTITGNNGKKLSVNTGVQLSPSDEFIMTLSDEYNEYENAYIASFVGGAVKNANRSILTLMSLEGFVNEDTGADDYGVHIYNGSISYSGTTVIMEFNLSHLTHVTFPPLRYTWYLIKNA